MQIINEQKILILELRFKDVSATQNKIKTDEEDGRNWDVTKSYTFNKMSLQKLLIQNCLFRDEKNNIITERN